MMTWLLMRRSSDSEIESKKKEHPDMGAEKHGPDNDADDDKVDDEIVAA